MASAVCLIRIYECIATLPQYDSANRGNNEHPTILKEIIDIDLDYLLYLHLCTATLTQATITYYRWRQYNSSTYHTCSL